jgi:hypothetical protein
MFPRLEWFVVHLSACLSTQITLTITATNNYDANTVNCNNNPAGLVYVVMSNDCPCNYATAYSSLTCGCEICRNYLQGCINCAILTTCLLCNETANFYLDPSGVCLCSLGYYHTVVTDTCDPGCGDGYVKNP